jgi:hypothetical protein
MAARLFSSTEAEEKTMIGVLNQLGQTAAVICLLAGQMHGQISKSSGTPATNDSYATTVTIPAGTRVLLALTSPLHTTSATAGSGIYTETAAAVVQDSHVVIPLRTQVQGVVEQEQRPGRVKGRAQFLLHFTTLIFPNNYVVPIDGVLQSVPGSKKLRTQDEKGRIEPVDQIDKDKG